jgi:transcriptional regulator with XRE-family HTH domain
MSNQVPASPSAVPEWTVADRLVKARKDAGLDQTELAELTGLSRATISNCERGVTPPTKPILLSWATYTGVPLDWLAGEGPTRRGGRRRRPRTRRTATLIPVAIAVAGYLSALTGGL